mmetsp:Transcript_17821/g.41064  ORF Transcript_17821/g.41064 Transcript_17821/m.41064 type:complete len:97 (+) Transcript_17821:160-450(+)
MTSMLVSELRAREERQEDDMTQQEVIEWYLLVRDDIDSDEGLIEARKKMQGVIQRLINVDHTLIVLNQEEIADITPEKKRREARKLSVHPNFVANS